MKKIKTLVLTLVLMLSTFCVASCATIDQVKDWTKDTWNKLIGNETEPEIVFVDDYDIPAVRIGVEYNFEPYFTKEEGTTYTMTAKYLDDELNEIDLDVNGFTFVQNEFSDVFVTITATKGDTVYTGEVTIPMDTTYDSTDYWVVDSLYADSAMTKSLNYLPAYRTSMDSLTSVKFSYRGNAKKDSPVSAISLMDWPNNSRLTVSDWSNAVITLDVYNTSEKDIALGFIMNHSSGISYSFDQCEKFICKPNEWTHIDYSLKALNLTEEFVFNADWDLSDRIIIQTVYDGAKEDSIYSYSFYVDNVDICDYSEEKFPNLDTTTYKEYEDFFTKDPNLSGVVNNDYENKKEAADLHNTTELVEYSNRSIKFVLSEDGSEASGFLHSFIGGHPTGWMPMDITDATLSFYIRTVNADNTFALKFESDYNVFAEPIVIDLTKDSGEGWTVTEENGWYKVAIDVAQTNVETALVRMDFIRTMRLYFSNEAAQAGSESAIYLDTLKLEGWKVTEVYGDEEIEWDTKSPYTAAEDHDMFSTDENLVFNVNYERVDTLSTADINERMDNSSYSYKLTLSANGDNATATVDSFFTGKPMDWTIMDITNATVSFGVKNVNVDNVFYVSFASDYNENGLILGAKVTIDLSQASGEGWTITQLENGWCLVTLDIKNADITDEVLGVTKDFIKIMHIEFSNTTATAGSESAVYLDNLNVVGAVPTSAALDEETPWETKSPYVNYVVTFKNADGSIISQTNYHYGDTVVEPENPSMPGGENECTFTFLGWDYTVTAVNCDATYTATYSLTNMSDLWNCTLENGGIDSITNDTEVKSENSSYSLNIVEPITSGNLPYFALTLDKTYDLTGKCIVFDFKDIAKDGWLVGFDFVNNGSKVGLWNMHTLKSGEKSASHKCEDLGDGWLRVYVYVDELSSSMNGVTAIYFTLNASDGSGELNLHFDNLHFEEKPEISTYIITFKDYDGRVISSAEYEEGATVVVPANPTREAIAGECTYTFAGWDYAVTAANCDATYTATYTLTNVLDLWNGNVENGGIDSLTNDTEVKSENSAHSLKIVEAISSGNLPYFAITLDKNYDLTGKYMVFDTNISKDGWLVVFDFVNNGAKLGLWNMLTLKSGTAESTHKCEDLGNGWIRVYVDADVLNGSLNSVSKIYVTLNASDGSGALNLHFDNLHFEEKPEIPTYTITFKDYDGRVISSAEYDEGATVVVPENPTRDGAGECTYTFAGWDYEVTAANCDATYTATYTVANVLDLWNCPVENGGIDTIANDTEVKSENSAHSLKIVEAISSGNLPYFALTLDKTYDLTGKYMVFDANISKDGWLVVFDFVNNGAKLGLWNMLTLKSGTAESTHKCEDLGNGWIRVYVDADVLNDSLNNVSKIYVTLNASDGSGTLTVNFDNLHFENKPTTPTPEEPETPNPEEPEVPDVTLTETDDSIGACGLVAVNGGSASIVTDTVSSNSEKSAKFNVPANNSGVWWNYDVDVTSVLGGGLNLVGKTITFDVKIVGNMTWVGFTVADGNGTYATPNGEGYAWMNLSNGWSGFGMSITAIENGWFRVSLTPDTSFSGASGNLTKLRFLVNPQDANEASMYVDNLYLGDAEKYQEPTRSEADDAIGACGLVAVNGGTMTVDTSVVSVNSEKSVKCTVPAGNSGVWWNYDISLVEANGGAVNLSGKTITFDLKIVGSMSLVGFTVEGNGAYAQPDGEGYVWTNLTDGWGADKGWVVTAMDNGWFRVSFTADTKFSGCSGNITKLRFLVNPSTADEASMYIDNLYLA